ncbi:hypothetical protein GWG65_27245 [Bradyrhizobium sp. CSA207]|uniref:hypothetical protein n=1 Tax=Bradyrhizobium sp. CSA207 TaxID=2698826 RepID=UPI0023AF9F18|nr:hypothetical protein [Bradyrhizobium sp. CSA207]MDE5445076.1 hypothetical protein [Bradyrhizobium sp. CSA207]
MGWLVAAAYLLASMTPSLAIAVPVDLSMHCADELVAGHEHEHAHGALAPHSHDAAMAADCDDDQDKPGGRHASCCGSVLCFSAVSPQAPSFVQFAAPRSLCASVPDLMGDDGTCSRHYRPPIVA